MIAAGIGFLVLAGVFVVVCVVLGIAVGAVSFIADNWK